MEQLITVLAMLLAALGLFPDGPRGPAAHSPAVDKRSSIIPPGMQVVAIPVNEVVGVAGFASPGMHVDVLISGTPLLQNIEVLSARDTGTMQVVSLLITPEQADKFRLTSHQASIQLVLRNPLSPLNDHSAH